MKNAFKIAKIFFIYYGASLTGAPLILLCFIECFKDHHLGEIEECFNSVAEIICKL